MKNKYTYYTLSLRRKFLELSRYLKFIPEFQSSHLEGNVLFNLIFFKSEISSAILFWMENLRFRIFPVKIYFLYCM
jgi:hypothetical protein